MNCVAETVTKMIESLPDGSPKGLGVQRKDLPIFKIILVEYGMNFAGTISMEGLIHRGEGLASRIIDRNLQSFKGQSINFNPMNAYLEGIEGMPN